MAAAWQSPTHDVKDESSALHPPEINPEEHESIDDGSQDEGNRDRKSDSLWRVLNERQINMIAFTGTIGNGLFLGSGKILATAGPGGAVLAYAIMGTVISAVISSVGEMTALMPVNAPMMEFPRRFLDRGVGFAVGWIYWFSYVVMGADQIVTVASAIRFQYGDDHTFISWETGMHTNPAIWISVFLVAVVILNMIPVKYFGEFEYLVGCIKIVFITMLILTMFILNVMQPRSNAYYSSSVGTKYWNPPYGFFNSVHRVKDEYGNLDQTITGSTGQFLGVWTACTRAFFAYTGMDMVTITAAESKALADSEAMKMASRKISLRIITLYILCVLTASFLVPTDHPFINGEGQSTGSRSIFIIAAVEAGLPALGQFFNSMFLFSAATCAADNLYVASRVLHTLALRDQTGPEFITRRLRQCRAGVPMRAVLLSAAVMLVAYLGPTGATGSRLNELSSNCTVSFLIVYATICATYLCFYRALDEAKQYGNTSQTQAATYDRNHVRYPYKSHAQWLKAGYGMVACIILLLFNGVDSFLTTPFDARTFIASYISIPVFFLLVVCYKIRRHGFRFSQWGPERSKDLRNCVQVSSDKRKGRLELSDPVFSFENVKRFGMWLWVWTK
ncbi:proline-specific permease [Penicillium brasilianum]|uniref:Proline-specific permease n=1 Tax=Penicillium brasilianum TaxID=104259 RepID=A0A1S9RFZ8_PENBI|nr:proline-specific permease [Penicillium brasilianum]